MIVDFIFYRLIYVCSLYDVSLNMHLYIDVLFFIFWIDWCMQSES